MFFHSLAEKWIFSLKFRLIEKQHSKFKEIPKALSYSFINYNLFNNVQKGQAGEPQNRQPAIVPLLEKFRKKASRRFF